MRWQLPAQKWDASHRRHGSITPAGDIHVVLTLCHGELPPLTAGIANASRPERRLLAAVVVSPVGSERDESVGGKRKDQQKARVGADSAR